MSRIVFINLIIVILFCSQFVVIYHDGGWRPVAIVFILHTMIYGLAQLRAKR